MTFYLIISRFCHILTVISDIHSQTFFYVATIPFFSLFDNLVSYNLDVGVIIIT